jgi:hypothetical protein
VLSSHVAIFFSIAKNIENKITLLQEWKNPPSKKNDHAMEWNNLFKKQNN